MSSSNNIWSRVRAMYEAHPVIGGILLMILIGLVLVWLCLLFLKAWTHHGATATVPEIKNLSYSEAERILESKDLTIEISDSIYDTSIAPGTVVETWPKAGSVVKAGRAVYVTITAFSPKHVTITMPIAGVSSRQAMSYLNALGISGIRFVSVPSQYPDLVERATVNGKPVGVGSIVPVDATVVLEVGTAMSEAEPDETSGDSISSEAAVEQDLTGYSTYIDDEDDI